jgi:hypothetical protein
MEGGGFGIVFTGVGLGTGFVKSRVRISRKAGWKAEMRHSGGKTDGGKDRLEFNEMKRTWPASKKVNLQPSLVREAGLGTRLFFGPAAIVSIVK